MIYIIGSGFSGLTTAYSLLKKNKDITVISPTFIKKKNKKLTLLKYLFSKNGEIKFNNNFISDKINSLEKVKYKNCKFISSYQDGGLSNIWGGVLSDIDNYKINKFPYNKKNLKVLEKKYKIFEKILFEHNFKKPKKKTIYNKHLSFVKYNNTNENTDNLKKFLIKKGVRFKYGFYLNKILDKKKEILLHNLHSGKKKKFKYKKVYLSCGPINTAKVLLNSFNTFKSIKIYETNHFYCLIKKIGRFEHTNFLNFNFKNIKFYAQLYNFINVIKKLSDIEIKKFDLLNNYYIAQCYLESKKSSYIKIYKKKPYNFIIEGNKDHIKNYEIKKIFKGYNKNSNNW